MAPTHGALFCSSGGGGSEHRIPLPRSPHQPRAGGPPCSYLKGHREQHVQEGGHVIRIAHPNLRPLSIRAGHLDGGWEALGSSLLGPKIRG